MQSDQTASARLAPSDPLDQIATLVRINTQDMLQAFGLGGVRRGRDVLHWLCQRPARRFARLVVQYDTLVGAAGLQAGGAWLIEQTVDQIEIRGQQHLPLHGALLIVANHPGLWDAAALFAATPRPDLRVLAADRPFLQALPHMSRTLITITDDPGNRLQVIRRTTRHLRSSGAVLTFPSGKIEPDPLSLPGASAALDRWSSSLDLWARLVPDLQIVPAIVGGVLAPAALRHPLTRLRRTEADQQWLAAILQIIWPRLHNVPLRVHFGPPIQPAALADRSPHAASRAVISGARDLIDAMTHAP